MPRFRHTFSLRWGFGLPLPLPAEPTRDPPAAPRRPAAVCTGSTAARRRGGLRSFPTPPPSGWRCPAPGHPATASAGRSHAPTQIHLGLAQLRDDLLRAEAPAWHPSLLIRPKSHAQPGSVFMGQGQGVDRRSLRQLDCTFLGNLLAMTGAPDADRHVVADARPPRLGQAADVLPTSVHRHSCRCWIQQGVGEFSMTTPGEN